jgi:hypothetical protein
MAPIAPGTNDWQELELKTHAAGADHKGACRATATRRQLENPRRQPVLFSTVDLTPRRRPTIVIRQLDATTP